MSRGTRSMSDSITQTVMADRANAVETVRPAAPAAKAKLTAAPPGFTDSVKEIQYEPREADAFGAIDVGDVVVAGGPTDAGSKAGDIVIEEEPDAKPDDITGDDPAKVDKPDDAADDEEATATGGDEAGESAKPDADKTDPPAATEKPRAAQRREMLDALKYQARNRTLVDEVQRARQAVDQATREAAQAKQEAAAAVEKLKGADLNERLKFLGIETKEELLELALTGKVTLPEVRPAPAKPQADDRVAAVEAELRQYRGQQMIRDAVAQAGLSPHFDKIYARAAEKWAAAGNKPGAEMDFVRYAIGVESYAQLFAKELTESQELDIPLSRAVPGMLDTIKESALQMWERAGFKAGEHAAYLKKAADTAEELVREQEAPKFKALGLEMPARGSKAAAKPAVVVPPPVGTKPAVKAPTKPAAPVGKRIAARGPAVDDDGLPLDGAQRDAIIKREMQKAGHKGWGSTF